MRLMNNVIPDTAALLMQGHEAAQHGVQEGAEHGGEAIGDVLIHHVANADYLDFLGHKVPLPHLPEMFGIDMSITKHVVMLWIAAALVFFVFAFGMKWKKMVPANGLTSFFEPIIIFVRDEIVYQTFGKDGKPFLPFFLTVFFFILFMNLLGLFPFMATATGNIMVTGALALISFVLIQVAGMVKNGFFTHWKNLVPSGVPAPLIPILIPVELMGMMAKPFALCIRLFANMTAGHIVIFAFLGLIILLENYFIASVAIPLAVAITAMEIFIAFLQAYIFTFLTALFVSMTYHPSH
ncbi:F0F1 ATP synthase subunit A [candidate division KSB1 bacterium]